MAPIATKITIPRRRKDTLRRTRLVEFIHEMIDRELFLVVAPAGYGKTTLLVDFASDSDIPVCWYSLGPTDAEPAVFLDYLVASIQAQFPKFGDDTRRVMAAANLRTDLFGVVGALVNDVQQHIPDYFVVVLDDFHEVNDSPVSDLVDTLLAHLPENFKLVISSRTIPRIRLSRLAARSQATGVGSEDLRFTTDEVRSLMRDYHNVSLTDKAAEELTHTSEGWITGIILTTHTMWQGLFESIIRGSGQAQLYDYLANEVFERQPLATQEFLTATAVLDDMDPAVVNQLVDVANSQEIFRGLEEQNLFVTRVGTRKSVFRYHHLFRDFLRARLERLPGKRSEFEARAGRIYAADGQYELAVPHLIAGADFQSAADAIAAIADQLFSAGRLQVLASWIDSLPADLQTHEPALLLRRSQIATQIGDLDRALELCDQLDQSALGAGNAVLRAEAKVSRAAALRLKGDSSQAASLCEDALRVFGDEVSARRAQALRTAGTCYWRLGDLHRAWDSHVASHELFQQVGDEAAAAYSKNDLGAMAIFLGRLGEARHQLEQSAAFWERVGNLGRHGLTLSNLGVVAYLEADYPEAIRLFESAEEKGRSGLFVFTQIVALCSLGDVYRDTGDFEKASRVYEDSLRLVLDGQDQAELTNVLTAMGQSYRLQGDYAKAETTLRRAENIASKQSSHYTLAQCHLAAGVCALEQGRYTRAKRLLGEAQKTFEAGGARYPLARTLFHRANADYRLGKVQQAFEQLTQCLNILEELGYHQFLLVEGKRCLDFLESAVKAGIGEDFLRNLVATVAAPVIEVTLRHEPLRPLAPDHPKLEARALGRVEVRVSGRVVALREWGSKTARELFFYLLLHRDGARKDELMTALAPESSTPRANSHFHVAAFRLRRALYRGCLRFENDYYQLDPQMDCVFDVDCFRSALAEADGYGAAESAQAGAALKKAVELYKGPFLDGTFSEWVTGYQRRLEEQFLSAVNRLAHLYAAKQEFRIAIETAEKGLEVDNSIEALHEIIVRAYLGLGDSVAARRHLDSYEEYVKAEFGVPLPLSLTQLCGQPQLRSEKKTRLGSG